MSYLTLSHVDMVFGTGASTNPVLKFLMQTNFTIQANFADVQNPTVAISAPPPDARLSNALVTVRGTASDNMVVTEVVYRLGSDSFQPAEGTSNWTATVALAYLTTCRT